MNKHCKFIITQTVNGEIFYCGSIDADSIYPTLMELFLPVHHGWEYDKTHKVMRIKNDGEIDFSRLCNALMKQLVEAGYTCQVDIFEDRPDFKDCQILIEDPNV